MKIKHAAVDSVAALRRLIKDLLSVSSQKINTGTSFLTLERLFNQKQVVTEVSLASNEEEMLKCVDIWDAAIHVPQGSLSLFIIWVK